MKIALVLGIGGVIALHNTPTLAQITPDATLGVESSQVISPTPRGFLINGGATRGTNLFHSFQEFSVPTNGFAYFNNGQTIQNILTRVTGASVSNIDGIIAANGNASLFLINPNGIVFGAGASLNIGGSFFAGTANSLVFDNGYQFSATNPQAPPLLTINLPLGVQYGANPGRIVNQALLGVPPGKTLALVGGDVTLQGGILYAPEGSIELGSVGGNSRVNLIPTNSGYTLDYEGIKNFQDIRLAQEAFVLSNSNGGSGNIQVQGRNVTLTDGSFIATSASGAGKGGSLIINASESVQVIGESADGQYPTSLNTIAGTRATGEAGDIRITTPTLLIRDGAQISAGTLGAGKGGSVIINASDSVQVIGTSADGSGSTLSASTSRTGDAGDIRITTPALQVRDRASISASTLGAGKGGSVIINASEQVQLFGGYLSALTTRNSTCDAGNLSITTGQLLVRDGAGVSADTTGAGKGGSVIINASQGVQLVGTSADGRFSSSLSASTLGTGDAGELRIITGQLLIKDGAFIDASTSGAGRGGSLIINASEGVQVIGTSADGRFGSFLSSSTFGTGDAGELSITTGQLLVRDGASINASTSGFGAGKGGRLTITSEGVQVIGIAADGRFGSSLFASTFGTGDAGELRITTGQLLIKDGASISADTSGAGKGGSVIINASQGVQLVGASADSRLASSLSTTSLGTGDAGELSITTGQLQIRDGALLTASTLSKGKGGSLIINASQGVQVIGTSADGKLGSRLLAQSTADSTGDAGNLTITTGQLLVRDGALVSASTLGTGKGGNLTINASEKVQVIGTSADGQFATGLLARTEGPSDAGDLLLSTRQLLVRDGAQVDASSFGAGKGGDLIINASEWVQVMGESADGKLGSNLSAQAEGAGAAGNLTITTGQLLVRDGANVSVATLGAGKGGNLIVRASESVQLIGTSADGQFPSGLFASVRGTSTAGDLTVETRQMSVRDGAKVTVSSPSGQAGNLTITANSLSLNRGTILAETAKSSPEGGANITLQGLDLVRMDNESLISANANNTANGGNIKIDSTFIVATPPKGPQGSDIVANAEKGNGGRVSITTQGLFGIEFRPQRTPKNDITVSSQFGLAGVYEQNTPGVDPSRGLAELPTNVVDASQQIDRRCTPRDPNQRSSFVITGRGGIPPSPNDVLQAESVITPNWVTLDSEKENNTPPTPKTPQNTAPKQLVEAQSWYINDLGQVVLTAEAPNVTPPGTWLPEPECNSPQPVTTP